MKKLFSIILLATLFIACSSDDDEPKQDYTSFVVYHNEPIKLGNCIAGYKKENKYYKIGDLGDLLKGEESNEIKIVDKSITSIYIFTDYNGVVRLDITFSLKNNIKNIFEIPATTRGIPVTDKTDPTQYPQ